MLVSSGRELSTEFFKVTWKSVESKVILVVHFSYLGDGLIDLGVWCSVGVCVGVWCSVGVCVGVWCGVGVCVWERECEVESKVILVVKACLVIENCFVSFPRIVWWRNQWGFTVKNIHLFPGRTACRELDSRESKWWLLSQGRYSYPSFADLLLLIPF